MHTSSHPYCSDLACSCHTDLSYHDQVQYQAERSTHSSDDASTFYNQVLSGETLQVASIQKIGKKEIVTYSF
jgi:hypothetical protein